MERMPSIAVFPHVHCECLQGGSEYELSATKMLHFQNDYICMCMCRQLLKHFPDHLFKITLKPSYLWSSPWFFPFLTQREMLSDLTRSYSQAVQYRLKPNCWTLNSLLFLLSLRVTSIYWTGAFCHCVLCVCTLEDYTRYLMSSHIYDLSRTSWCLFICLF